MEGGEIKGGVDIYMKIDERNVAKMERKKEGEGKEKKKHKVKKKKDSTEQTEKNIAMPPSQTKRLSHTLGQGRKEERKKGREKERKQTEAVPRDKDVRPKRPQELGTKRPAQNH